MGPATDTPTLAEPLKVKTDILFGTGPAPPTTLSRVASPPYTRARGRAPVGSPVGWAVRLRTPTSRALRPRHASRTAGPLAVLGGLGAWGGGSVGSCSFCVFARSGVPSNG